MRATQRGHKDMVQLLIDHGASITEPLDNSGMTLLMYAAMHDRLEIAKLLLEWGSNVVAEDKSGKAAVDYAKSEDMRVFLEVRIDGIKPHSLGMDGFIVGDGWVYAALETIY